MSTYHNRIENNQCTRCGGDHAENWSLKKCKGCSKNESEYRKKTRSKRREQEKQYRIKNWARRCVYLSRGTDLRKNRPVGDGYITAKRLKTLRALQMNRCYYCSIEMQIENRKKANGLTTERLNNSIPHTENNVVLCCSSCNCRKLSNHHNTSIDTAYRTILSRLEECPAWNTFIETLSQDRQLDE